MHPAKDGSYAVRLRIKPDKMKELILKGMYELNGFIIPNPSTAKSVNARNPYTLGVPALIPDQMGTGEVTMRIATRILDQRLLDTLPLEHSHRHDNKNQPWHQNRPTA